MKMTGTESPPNRDEGDGDSSPRESQESQDGGERTGSKEARMVYVGSVGPGRKSKACFECKKMKMRCEVFPGDRKCKHCLRRKADCVFKAPRMIQAPPRPAENAAFSAVYDRKLDIMREELRQMKRSLDAVLVAKQPSMTALDAAYTASAIQPSTPLSAISHAAVSAREETTHMAMTRENSAEPGQVTDPHQGAVTVEEPMGSLYEVTRLRNIRSSKAKTSRSVAERDGALNDFISRGVVSELEAEELYRLFQMSLNQYMWVGMEQTHPTLLSVRQSSEVLTAAVLVVTALHMPTSSETFDKCYREFLSLISSSMFSRYHSIDDVRGLCIAAFWLSDVSWMLSGHAIRIAIELNIHQSFLKALEGDREHFIRARLWYMLYVCDHHFSIAYGRPPMIAETVQIREYELFLASPMADTVDFRIMAQVNLMQILTRVYERFSEPRLPAAATVRGGIRGSSHDSTATMLSEEDFVDVRNFNLEIEQWRMRWYARMKPNRFLGTFPPKGVILYSYFAKLQVNVLAVRNVSLASGRLSTERRELANIAISSAASVLTYVLEEEDMRRALVGLPLYVHSMIAFACVFLMKVATKWNRIMGFNVEHSYLNVSRLLEKTILLLRSSVTSKWHVLHHIAAGLEKMLAKMTAEGAAQETPSTNGMEEASLNEPVQPNLKLAMDGSMFATGDFDPMTATVPLATSTWGTEVGVPVGGNGVDAEHMTFISDDLLYEAFGAEANNDVYHLLTSHFT